MERRRVVTPGGGELLTKQAPKDEVDSQAIVQKYLRTGNVELLRQRVAPRYGDFTSADDYLSAMVKVRQAQELFSALPSNVRSAVRNDPAELLRLVFDPARREECVKLGLISEADPVVPEAQAAAGAAVVERGVREEAPAKDGSEPAPKPSPKPVPKEGGPQGKG